MTEIILIAFGSLLFGLFLFPMLFYFQRKLSLPIPNLEKKRLHIHHSAYGLLLMVVGIILFFLSHRESGVVFFLIGIGFIAHHKISEPHWKGIENFIYIKKKEDD